MWENYTSWCRMEGKKYFANFCFAPGDFSNTQHQLYDAMLDGNGNLKGDRCVVRVLKYAKGTTEDWEDYCKTREMLREIHSTFESIGYKDMFKVPTYTVVKIRAVSLMTELTILCSHLRCPTSGDRVLIDNIPKRHDEEIINNDIMEAASHFSLVMTGGKNILINFRGFYFRSSKSSSGEAPVLYITGADLKETDLESFLRGHRCNVYCKQWLSEVGPEKYTCTRAPTPAGHLINNQINQKLYVPIKPRGLYPDIRQLYDEYGLEYGLEHDLPPLYTP